MRYAFVFRGTICRCTCQSNRWSPFISSPHRLFAKRISLRVGHFRSTHQTHPIHAHSIEKPDYGERTHSPNEVMNKRKEKEKLPLMSTLNTRTQPVGAPKGPYITPHTSSKYDTFVSSFFFSFFRRFNRPHVDGEKERNSIGCVIISVQFPFSLICVHVPLASVFPATFGSHISIIRLSRTGVCVAWCRR